MDLRYLVFGAAVALVSTAALAQPGHAPGIERAQLPLPYAVPGPRSCSAQAQKLLKMQMDAMRQLQRLSRKEGDTLCAALDSADTMGVDKFLDLKGLQRFLRPEQRELMEAFGFDLAKVDIAKVMRLFGVDLSQIDLRQLRHQCRQGQGEIDRFASSEIGRLENEMIRCDDRI
jgi:hypothetical protein